MLKQQLEAVKYLHASGITHRDIKPANILLESRVPSLVTKLTDFGLSSKKTRPETFCGTKTYLAPEVYKKGGWYSNAVDIWSLGVVGLKYSYGLPRLREWDALDWADEVHHRAHECEGKLAALLQNMLKLLPSARYSAETCLTSTVFADSTKGNEGSPPQLPTHSTRKTRRHLKAMPQARPGDLFGAISGGSTRRNPPA